MYAVTIQPTLEPVTLQEAKDHLRIDYDSEDGLIAVLISAARQYCEHYTNQAFLTQTITERFEPDTELILTLAPVASVESVKVGSDTLTLNDGYTVEDYVTHKAIILTTAPAAAPVVTYVAGISDPLEVPPAVKVAMLQLIGDMHASRTNAVRNLPTKAMTMLNTVRRWLT